MRDGRAGRFFIDEKTYRLLVNSGQVKPTIARAQVRSPTRLASSSRRPAPTRKANSAPTPTRAVKEGAGGRWGSGDARSALTSLPCSGGR